jgi:hypothetical protein
MIQGEQMDNPPTGEKINYRLYFWGIIGAMVLIASLVLSYSYKKHQAEELKRSEYAKYEEMHRGQVKDSLALVNRNKAVYAYQLRTMQVRDSAFATLRYRKGDVVYLKPDSLRGCIWGLESDSMMFNYSYYIIVANKGQDPVIFKREDKLIY